MSEWRKRKFCNIESCPDDSCSGWRSGEICVYHHAFDDQVKFESNEVDALVCKDTSCRGVGCIKASCRYFHKSQQQEYTKRETILNARMKAKSREDDLKRENTNLKDRITLIEKGIDNTPIANAVKEEFSQFLGNVEILKETFARTLARYETAMRSVKEFETPETWKNDVLAEKSKMGQDIQKLIAERDAMAKKLDELSAAEKERDVLKAKLDKITNIASS